ncbi:MAG: sulfatase-like hydrolase/transferase [Chitinivibrionales bacterium]|nr:sulfatase-like hydrolase/transferase [Chitinivibrionales bacterium]
MADKPNLILVFADQQHWQAVGVVDSYYRTPNWDRFACNAVRFSTVYCTTPLCSPSRASLMTGRMPHRTGVVDNGIHLREPTIAARLRQAGYQTAYFGKWHLGDHELATDGWDRKEGVYDEYRAPNRPLSDAETLAHARSFIEAVDDSRAPFALFISFDEPHGVYVAMPDSPYPRSHCAVPPPRPDTALPKSWQHEAGGDTIPHPYLPPAQHAYWQSMHGESEWRRYREIYADRVAAYDSSLGHVLDTIEKRGLQDRSVIAVTADHGDMDTHHRLVFKGPLPYEQVQRVPLAIRAPGMSGSRTDSTSLVSLLDLHATLADYAGVDRGDGLSLRASLEQGAAHAREELVVQYPAPAIRTLRRGALKYTRYAGGRELLFDLAQDPRELHNLCHSARYQHETRDMRVRLEQWCRRKDDRFGWEEQ